MSVTVTYTWPPNLGSAITPPTAAQMQNYNSVAALVAATSDNDTTAVIDHNLGLTTAELGYGMPYIRIIPTGATAGLSSWYNVLADNLTNSITLTKSTASGSGASGNQIQVIIERPHTIVQ